MPVFCCSQPHRPKRRRHAQNSANPVALRLLLAALYGKGGIVRGKISVSLTLRPALLLSSISRAAASCAVQPQVIAVTATARDRHLQVAADPPRSHPTPRSCMISLSCR
jgi:hypothetical protein